LNSKLSFTKPVNYERRDANSDKAEKADYAW
jgi:hypothetical protein